MKANATPGDDESDGRSPAPSVHPVAPDLPFVDGTQVSSAELRAEVEALDDDAYARVEELRAEVADTVGELAKRVDVPARWRARRDDTAAMIRKGALDGARSPAGLVLAGVAALLLVAVVRRRWRS